MKKNILFLVLFLMTLIDTYAQNLSNENFIYTETPKKPVQSSNYSSLSAQDKQKNVTYYDGLGRPMQTIAIGQGGNGEDIITPIAYDAFGRQDKDYLPYTASFSGAYRTDALIGVSTLYNSLKYDYTVSPRPTTSCIISNYN